MPEYGSRQIWNLFEERARAESALPAIQTPAGELRLSQLKTAAEELTRGLSAKGIGEGETIGLSLPNSLAFVPTFLALCKLSARVALISPLFQAAELRSIVERLRPTRILSFTPLGAGHETGLEFAPAGQVTVPGAETQPILLLRPHYDAQAAREALKPASIPEQTAIIKLSSGSTGEPKGIALSGANILAEATNVVETLGVAPGDRILSPVPLFHSYGFDLGVLPCVTAGATLVLQDRFVPRTVARRLATGDVAVFLGVPAMYRAMLDAFPVSEKPKLSGARYLLSCTAPLHPALIGAFHDAFRAPICQHYGSSETGAVTNHDPAEVLARLTSVGTPMRNVQVRIVDTEGRECRPGTEGEVVVSSRAIACGYVCGAPTDRSPLRDGTFHTGDLGILDKAGFLEVRGRIDRIINVGGLKVSPIEVERVLESHPRVKEAVVLRAKDALGEEVVHAVIAAREALSEADLQEFCRQRLAEYKVPRRIQIRDELPRGPSGKVRITSEELQP